MRSCLVTLIQAFFVIGPPHGRGTHSSSSTSKKKYFSAWLLIVLYGCQCIIHCRRGAASFCCSTLNCCCSFSPLLVVFLGFAIFLNELCESITCRCSLWMKHSYVFLPCFHLLPHTNLIGAKTPALPKIAVVFFELYLPVLFISCISSALIIFKQRACGTFSYTQSQIFILTIYIISKKKRVACTPAFLWLLYN